MNVFMRLSAILLLVWIVAGCSDQGMDAEIHSIETSLAPAEPDDPGVPIEVDIEAVDSDPDRTMPPGVPFEVPDGELMDEGEEAFATEEPMEGEVAAMEANVEGFPLEEFRVPDASFPAPDEELTASPADPDFGPSAPGQDNSSRAEVFGVSDQDYELEKIYYGTDRAPEAGPARTLGDLQKTGNLRFDLKFSRDGLCTLRSMSGYGEPAHAGRDTR